MSPAPRSDRGVATSLCLLVTCLTLLFSQAAITDGSDGRSMYEVTRSVVERGRLDIPARYGFPGRDGNYYASHGMGLPLAAIVPYVVAMPLQRTWLGERAAEVAVASLMPLVTGLLAAALYRLSRRLGADVSGAMTAALGATLGTYVLAFSKEFFSEPLAALCLVAAIERAVAGRAATAGIAAAAAALTRPQYFAVAPIVVWRLWRHGGWPAATRAAAAVGVALLLTVAYNVARFEDPMQFGYEGLGFSTPLLRGATGLLFHPDKSILLFAPIVALVPLALRWLWAVNRSACWLIGGNLLLTFVTLATWVDWYGGWVWGPRPLIPGVVPAVAAVAAWAGSRTYRRRVVAGLFLAGFVVSAPTLVVSQRAQLISDAGPIGPHILRQYRLVPETVAFTIEHAGESPPEARYERFVNAWQVSLIRREGRRGAWLAAAASLGLLLTAGASARRLRAALRRPLMSSPSRA